MRIFMKKLFYACLIAISCTLANAAAQPSFRLLRNLMEPDIRMDEKFIKEQERRRLKRLGDQIYDVTAWSLPLLYDVDVVTSPTPVTAKSTPVRPGARGSPPRSHLPHTIDRVLGNVRGHMKARRKALGRGPGPVVPPGRRDQLR